MSSQGRDRGHGVHFFKVILESNLRDGVLRVPKSFVRRYWQGMSHPIFLRLPNGTEWKVYWLTNDGDVLFRNGWKEFAEYLSLKEAQFLLFRYEGKSKFNVIVLGSSGLEIKYPSSKRDDGEGRKGDDRSLEILNGKRPRSPSPSSQIPKKMKRTSKEEPKSYSIDAETKHWKNKAHGGLDSAKHKGSGNTEISRIIKKFHETVKNNFHSENDYFVCSLHKTYTLRDLLVIPNEFAKPILHRREGKASLFLDQNRTWNVKMKFSNTRQFTITSGWKKFLEANNLKYGDICVFELINCKEISFRVHIYRFGEDLSTSRFEDQEGPSHRPPSSLRNHETPKANSRLISKNYFTIHIKRTIRTTHFAVIPIDFFRNYPIHNGKFATLRVENREWQVRLLYYPQNCCARFSQGWPNFVKECNLEEGDSCRFEIINVENLEFQVSVTRHKLN